VGATANCPRSEQRHGAWNRLGIEPTLHLEVATMARVIAELVLDEGQWFFASVLLATIVVWAALRRSPAQRPARSGRILWAMNLFYGCMIGTMATGRLLEVTVKLAQGSLRGSWLALYPLGLVLAITAWWLAVRAAR
jgi:hypothetical protein